MMEVRRLAGEMRVESFLERTEVVGMNTAGPFLGPYEPGFSRRPHHRAPAARDVELLAAQIPFPPAVVRALGGQREPLLASPERAVGVCARGRVVPQQRPS